MICRMRPAHWKKYRDSRGEAGIVSFQYNHDSIQIRFKRGGIYEYRADKIGAGNLKKMKELADSGIGLTTFINTHPEVKNGYSHRRES